MKHASKFRSLLCVMIVALAGCASGPKFQAFSPDSQNPNHRRFIENFVLLLRAANRDPMECSIFFFNSRNMKATSLGDCMFAFTTGLASTGDERLIRAIQAIEAAHEVLGHAEKRKGKHEAIQVAGALLSQGRFAIPSFPLPPYSQPQQAEAEKKAAEILQSAGDPNPTEAIEHASERLRDIGIVEPWPENEPAHFRFYKVMMAMTPLMTEAAPPTYTLGQKWIRSDGEYTLTRIDKDLYVFSAGRDQEFRLTRDLMVAKAKKGGWVTEFEFFPTSLPKLWPLVVGRWGEGEGHWWVPMDPTRLQVKYTWTVEALEELRLPAGAFKAFRIVFEWQPAKRLTMWYAPDIRQLVKAEYSQSGPLNFHIIALDAPLPPSSSTSQAPEEK